jgi:hypothetical protein
MNHSGRNACQTLQRRRLIQVAHQRFDTQRAHRFQAMAARSQRQFAQGARQECSNTQPDITAAHNQNALTTKSCG